MSEARKNTRSYSANLQTRDLDANACIKVTVMYLKDKKEQWFADNLPTCTCILPRYPSHYACKQSENQWLDLLIIYTTNIKQLLFHSLIQKTEYRDDASLARLE
ncbi:hypothetical protein [Vibrio campbellii]|uniref:Uncharacterized protein n=1 Tax=Vibrio campbellii TaxID=680 RepID=A0ABY5IHJ9_9VIBR|nr:hypothetical protein [Vibrio campbellii]UTZ24095.1 hypothetical protein HB760_20295 [Vibrio campbellii]UTZ33770.1 hypothetical protein HB762_21145 [Vibrio campbellii]